MRITSYDRTIFEHFKEYRCSSSDLDHIVGWEVFDLEQILVSLDNGDKIFYDHMSGGVRYLSVEYLERDMTEEEWKREFMFRLRDKMNHFGIGQKVLCNRTGISQTMISHYMNGYSIPSFYMASRIAKGLGCSVDELLRFPGRS